MESLIYRIAQHVGLDELLSPALRDLLAVAQPIYLPLYAVDLGLFGVQLVVQARDVFAITSLAVAEVIQQGYLTLHPPLLIFPSTLLKFPSTPPYFSIVLT